MRARDTHAFMFTYCMKIEIATGDALEHSAQFRLVEADLFA